MTAIYITRGEHRGERFRGRDADSIARRIYGRKAVVWPSHDPNSPEDGTIGDPVDNGRGLSVRATFCYY